MSGYVTILIYIILLVIMNENTLKPITIFLPGSVNMPYKINKANTILVNVLLKQSAFFIGDYTESVFNSFKDFTIETIMLLIKKI